ncbi:MAG TPA: PspC domain-containing protein [Calditrichaeota bacterium]|nr:PspC domain-containing protein [Calditrichota bacterium]
MYIASVIIIPENPDEIGEEEQTKKSDEKTLFWGALLIIIGIGLLLKQFGFFHYFNFWSIPWQLIWAIFLILVGIFLLYNRESGRFFKGTETEYDTDNEPYEKQNPIYRSRENRMLSGVCGGLAEYFKIDPTIVRLVYLFLTLASVGIGVIAYIIMVIVFPEKPYENDSSAIERKV